MKIENALVSNILDRSQRYFAHVTTVTLSWRVQNIVVIGRVYFTLECFEFSSNFEFDRNMLSGTGARPWWVNLFLFVLYFPRGWNLSIFQCDDPFPAFILWFGYCFTNVFFFQRNSYSMAISFWYYPDFDGLITIKFRAWHNNCAVMACAGIWYHQYKHSKTVNLR